MSTETQIGMIRDILPVFLPDISMAGLKQPGCEMKNIVMVKIAHKSQKEFLPENDQKICYKTMYLLTAPLRFSWNFAIVACSCPILSVSLRRGLCCWFHSRDFSNKCWTFWKHRTSRTSENYGFLIHIWELSDVICSLSFIISAKELTNTARGFCDDISNDFHSLLLNITEKYS